jgi:hypothetical protein
MGLIGIKNILGTKRSLVRIFFIFASKYVIFAVPDVIWEVPHVIWETPDANWETQDVIKIYPIIFSKVINTKS